MKLIYMRRALAFLFVAILSVPATSLATDTETQTPILISPSASSVNVATLTITYVLPETPLSGSVTMIFLQGSAPIATLNFGNSLSVNTSINPFTSSIVNSEIISTSGFPLAEGSYDVRLSYQDVFINPAASVTNTGVEILTTIASPTPTATPTPSSIPTVTPTPTTTGCTSTVKRPRVKITKRSASLRIRTFNNAHYTVHADSISHPSQKSKNNKFVGNDEKYRVVVFSKLKPGSWSFYYTVKKNSNTVNSCTVEKEVGS